MIVLVRFIAIFVTCMGGWVFLVPKAMRGMITFWQQGRRIYLGILLRILIGMVFLLSASRARQPQVMLVLGALVVAVGVFALILGPEKVKAILKWIDKKPDSFLRLTALVVLAFGTLIIFSA